MNYQNKYNKYLEKYNKLKGGFVINEGEDNELYIPPEVIHENIFSTITSVKDALRYSRISQAARDAVRTYPWNFYDDPIPNFMTIRRFFELFPNAIGLNIANRYYEIDDDFIYIPKDEDGNCKLKYLNMQSCYRITDAAFVDLKGIHTLNMQSCYEITDAAFVHLKGIHTLNMQSCHQITDAVFVHLEGIHTLFLGNCRQITDAAFVHLKGIHTLYIDHCYEITDAAFVHLKGIHTLYIHEIKNLTKNAFINLIGIKKLVCDDEYYVYKYNLLNNTPVEKWVK